MDKRCFKQIGFNVMQQIFVCECPDETVTQNLAAKMAEITRPGDVWALFGTLGMGKSVWARGFIKYLCKVQDVPSPTFTLVQTYEADGFDVFHFDLYRLKSPEEIWELNIEEALNCGVSLIEWPEKMGGYLPRNAFKVKISALGDGARRFEISTDDMEKTNRLLQIGLNLQQI